MEKLRHEVIKEDITNQDCMFKLIIIGDTGVGKSCLMLRGTKDEFRDDHDVTIGVEFGSFAVRIEDKVVKVQIWDTAGQETFKSVTKVFYKGAHCIFLVYNITKESSFTKLEEWLREIRDTASSSTLLVLVGNMLDLEDKRAVQKAQAMEFKNREKLDAFAETSAKTGANALDLFVKTAKMLYLQEKDRNSGNQSTANGIESGQGNILIDNTTTPKPKRKGCSC